MNGQTKQNKNGLIETETKEMVASGRGGWVKRVKGNVVVTL